MALSLKALLVHNLQQRPRYHDARLCIPVRIKERVIQSVFIAKVDAESMIKTTEVILRI